MATRHTRLVSKYLGATGGVVALTLVLIEIRSHANLTTVALALVLLVMFTAVKMGSGAALWASVLGAMGFNYFFVPPVHSLTISGTENWVSLIALVITAMVVGQLSSRARERAD